MMDTEEWPDPADEAVEKLEAEIAELEEKRNTWQELAEMRCDKIAELEAKVDALRFSLDEVGTRNLKANAIREMVEYFINLQSLTNEQMLKYADILEKE